MIVGLALILVYGIHAPAGGWLERHGIQIIFAVPGMVLATVFVSLPLVVRAIVPVLQELGQEQEQAAHTLGASRWTAFRRITIPSIRWALAYGIVLCLARALGEYGALAVVSGRIVGQTQTVTLYVEQEYNNIDQPGAYAAATVLALIAIIALADHEAAAAAGGSGRRTVHPRRPGRARRHGRSHRTRRRSRCPGPGRTADRDAVPATPVSPKEPS